MKFFSFFLIIPTLFFSQKSEIVPVKKGNFWGFAAKNMKFLIEPQYDKAFPFENYRLYNPSTRKHEIVKLAKVYKGRELICIDELNTERKCTNLSPYTQESLLNVSVSTETSPEKPNVEYNLPKEIWQKYESAEIFYLEPIIYLVKSKGKKGLVDENGKVIVPLMFDFIDRNRIWEDSKVQETFFAATIYSNTGSSYCFDLKGNLIIKSFAHISSADSHNNYIIIKNAKGKFQIFNMVKRKFINTKTYDKAFDIFINGYMLVERGTKEFYINENGEEYLLK